MQYGHCVVSATAIAISSLYFFGIAPAAKADWSKALKPAIDSGASCPMGAIRLRSYISNIGTPFQLVGRLAEKNQSACALSPLSRRVRAWSKEAGSSSESAT